MDRAVPVGMKKLLPFTVIAAMLCSIGVASADRRGRGDRDRDHRWRDGDHGRRGHVVVRDRREIRQRPRVERRTIYVRDGAFHFHGGVVKRWRAPVIRHRFFDVRVRPVPVVEYYDQVPGYVWIAGQWQWNGYEWTWMAGHYEIAPDYYDDDDGYGYGYDYGYAAPSY